MHFILAGMPSLTLSDAGRMRVETISFFLVGLLLSACLIQLLWYYRCGVLPAVAVLGYPRAVAFAALWGLVFILVLTMISGARELMTPGAWKKNGLTYQLRQDEPEGK